MAPPRTYVVCPERGNRVYVALAYEVAAALDGSLDGTDLLTAEGLARRPPKELATATLLLVNPMECALTGPDFVARATGASRRVAVLAECAETRWYRKQFNLGLEFSAVFDVGFSSQEDRHEPRDVPYRFVFNGPRRGETFPSSSAARRPLPWALIGHETPIRAALAAKLAERLSPAGFVFLPYLRQPSSSGGMLSPRALRSVLAQTVLYVWCSHHAFAYYESFRFRDALLAGAVPCKIDPRRAADVPGVYRDVDELAQRLETTHVEALLREAVDYYEAGGSLAEQLRNAYERIP